MSNPRLTCYIQYAAQGESVTDSGRIYWSDSGKNASFKKCKVNAIENLDFLF